MLFPELKTDFFSPIHSHFFKEKISFKQLNFPELFKHCYCSQWEYFLFNSSYVTWWEFSWVSIIATLREFAGHLTDKSTSLSRVRILIQIIHSNKSLARQDAKMNKAWHLPSKSLQFRRGDEKVHWLYIKHDCHSLPSPLSPSSGNKIKEREREYYAWKCSILIS